MGAADLFTEVGGMPLSEAAARFAAAGVPVFPCLPGEKRPLVLRGFHDATADPAQVAEWWSRWPSANIGIPTGAVSGVEVVDVDVHPTGTGFPAFREAHRQGHAAGWAALVRTPSGGLHAYYPVNPDRAQSSWQAARAHVDFRGDGGYIIAPPSKVLRPAGCGQRTGSSSHQVIPRCQWMRCGCASFWTRALRSLSTVCVLLGLSGGGRMRRCSPAGWRGVVRVSGTGACSGPRADSQNPAPHSTQPSTPWALRRSTRDWGRGRSWRRSDPPTAPPTPHRIRL